MTDNTTDRLKAFEKYLEGDDLEYYKALPYNCLKLYYLKYKIPDNYLLINY